GCGAWRFGGSATATRPAPGVKNAEGKAKRARSIREPERGMRRKATAIVKPVNSPDLERLCGGAGNARPPRRMTATPSAANLRIGRRVTRQGSPHHLTAFRLERGVRNAQVRPGVVRVVRGRLRCVGPEHARLQGVLQETLRPAGLERSFSRAVDQIAEALP